MNLQIITPDKKVFDDEVIQVQVPGSKGSFQILNNHAPIISTLENGKIKIIDTNNKTLTVSINGGVIEVKNNKIIILADST